ncbi:hypothetical protein [Cryptosporangium arvum]|uniref:hypothetical protein n=1 Tax=Cryptosporangium arvum TaxID=80871 RepID=UPI0004AF90D3|nr:hypothetical protein [Cryptosporangium arvum]
MSDDDDAKTATDQATEPAPADGGPAADDSVTTTEPAGTPGTDKNDDKDDKRPKREKKTRKGLKDEGAAGEALRDDDYNPTEEELLHDFRQEGVRLFTGPGGRRIDTNQGTASLGDHSQSAGNDIVNNFFEAGARRFLGIAWNPRSREWITQLQDYFVEGTPDESGATSLRRLIEALNTAPDGVVCVRGQVGSGRETLAIRALHEVVGVDAFGGTATTDPQRLRPDDLEVGTGYVIGVSALLAHSIEETVEHVRSVAARRTTKIVLLLAPEVVVPGAVVSHAAPDSLAVLRALLHRRDRIGVPEDLLGSADVRGVLVGAPLSEVSTIALELGDAVRSGRPYTFRSKLRRTALEKFRAAAIDPPGNAEAGGASGEPKAADESSAGAANPECVQLFRRAFLVSAAIFYGLPLASVTKATTSLAQYLAADDADLAKAMVPFTQPTPALLTWLEADPQVPTADTGLDPVGRRTVRLQKPQMADVILEVVWNDYHLVGEMLLEWLHRLAVGGVPGLNAEPELRLRAAQAVGRLAVYDFAAVKERIDKWINENAAGRRAAGLAAQVILADSRTGAAFAREVSGWTYRAFPWRQVALLVYSRTLDEDQVPAALALLRYAAPQQQHAWSYAGAAVFTKILVQPGGAEHVFTLLDEWYRRVATAPRRDVGRGRDATAALSLTAARCALLVGEYAVGAFPAELRTTLTTNARHWELFVWAWSLALTRSEVFGDGWRLLARWVERSDTDPVLRAVCRRLLAALHQHDRIRIKLTFYARVWRAGWRAPRPESERLLAHLLVPQGARS